MIKRNTDDRCSEAAIHNFRSENIDMIDTVFGVNIQEVMLKANHTALNYSQTVGISSVEL